MAKQIEEKSTVPQPATREQRIERVLACLGRAAGMRSSLPENVQDALASFCGDDGLLKPGSRDDAQKVLTDYWDSLKATVEDGAVDHDGAPDAEPQPAPTEGT